MGELDASQGFSKLKGQVSKLKSKVVNPMEKDLGALVKTAHSRGPIRQVGGVVAAIRGLSASPRSHRANLQRRARGLRAL